MCVNESKVLDILSNYVKYVCLFVRYDRAPKRLTYFDGIWGVLFMGLFRNAVNAKWGGLKPGYKRLSLIHFQLIFVSMVKEYFMKKSACLKELYEKTYYG